MPLLPGEVYWAFVDKRRPVVIVSREELNRGDYVVVLPLTTAQLLLRASLPNCVTIAGGAAGIKECAAQAEMVSVLFRSDLVAPENGPVARLNDEKMREIIRAIGFVILADCEPL